MKYEKFDKDGVPYIRISTPPYDCIERPMVDADKELFKDSDTVDVPPNEPVPQEPYPEGP